MPPGEVRKVIDSKGPTGMGICEFPGGSYDFSMWN